MFLSIRYWPGCPPCPRGWSWGPIYWQHCPFCPREWSWVSGTDLDVHLVLGDGLEEQALTSMLTLSQGMVLRTNYWPRCPPCPRGWSWGPSTDLDVHLVPGDGLEDQVLRPFNVQDEEVHSGVAQGQEEAVQGKALDLKEEVTFREVFYERDIFLKVLKIKSVLSVSALTVFYNFWLPIWGEN